MNVIWLIEAAADIELQIGARRDDDEVKSPAVTVDPGSVVFPLHRMDSFG